MARKEARKPGYDGLLGVAGRFMGMHKDLLWEQGVGGSNPLATTNSIADGMSAEDLKPANADRREEEAMLNPAVSRPVGGAGGA
jgi:hypothetical protein